VLVVAQGRRPRRGCPGDTDVGPQAGQQVGQRCLVFLAEAGVEPGVERRGGAPQGQEHLVALVGERDYLDAAVGRVADAGDQSVGVHRV
jgi:hypothetical protein